MLKISVCLIFALSLANASPLRNVFNEDFDDFSRNSMPKDSSDFEDLYDAYLRRREPSESRLEDYLLTQPKRSYDETYDRDMPDDEEEDFWPEPRNDDRYDLAERNRLYDDEEKFNEANDDFGEAHYRSYINDEDGEESVFNDEELPNDEDSRDHMAMASETFDDAEDLEEGNDEADSEELEEEKEDYEVDEPKNQPQVAADEDAEEYEPEVNTNDEAEYEADMFNKAEDGIMLSNDENAYNEAKEEYEDKLQDEAEEAEEDYEDEAVEEPEKSLEKSQDESEEKAEDESAEKYQDETELGPEEMSFDEAKEEQLYAPDEPKAGADDESKESEDAATESEDEAERFGATAGEKSNDEAEETEDKLQEDEDETRDEAKDEPMKAKKSDEHRQPEKRLRGSLTHLRDLPSDWKMVEDQRKMERELDYFKKNAFPKAKDDEPYEFDK